MFGEFRPVFGREKKREREGKSLTAFSDILNFFEKSFFWETIES